MSVIGNFTAPKAYDREHQSQFIGAVQRELDKSYRKDTDIIIPLGKSLGFTSAQGAEYIFSVDVDGNFTFGARAETGTSLASIDYVTSVVSDASGASASEFAAIRAEFAAADAAVSASVTNEATVRAGADGALATQINAVNAAYIASDAVLSASIISEQTTRADADTAIALSVTTLTSTVDAKNQTFIQTSAPTAIAAGDLWIDSDDNNKLYRATAPGTGSWVAVPYSDTGKVTTFAQTSAPTALAVGDLWIDTDDDNKVYRATAVGSGSWAAVDDARIAVTATTLATVQGYLSASYTIELDVNGRATIFRLQDDGTTSDIIFKSDTFKFFDGVSDVALFSAGGGIITINGDLAVSGSIVVGEIRWPVALQPKLINKADGEAVLWAEGAALSAVPDFTIAVPSGVALAAGEAWEPPTITSATTTGGTLRLKISTPSTTATVTDSTDASGGGGNPDRVMAKSDSADAYNAVYNFRVQGLLYVTSYYSTDAGGYVNDGELILSTWFDDGGGFDEGPSIYINPWDAGIAAVTVSSQTGTHAYDLTVPTTWANAIGAGGTYAYGVSKDTGHASSTLTDLTSVSYLKQTVSGTRTGSPNGETATISVLPKNQ